MERVPSARRSAGWKLSAAAFSAAALMAAFGATEVRAEEDATARAFSTSEPRMMRLGARSSGSFEDEPVVRGRTARRTSSKSRRARSQADYSYDEDDSDGPVVRGHSRRSGESRRRRSSRGVRVASLGDSYAPSRKTGPSLSGGGGIRWVASAGCLVGSLRSVIAEVAQRFGSVTVNSTCRSRSRNARAGGAHRSHHLTGSAADFRVHGSVGAVHSFLRSHGSVGGLKHYGGGLFHIDTGSRRSW